LFSGCYKGICPEKKAGLWLMLTCSIALMIMAAIPELIIPAKKKSTS